MAVTLLPVWISNRPGVGRVNELTSAIGDISRAVVNLSHFDVIPSNPSSQSNCVFGMLVILQLRLAKAGSKLKLCDLTPKVLTQLKNARLDHFFDICGDEASALASF